MDKNGLIGTGSRARMVLFTGQGLSTELVSISKRQWVFLRHFLDCGNLEQAAQRAEVEPRKASGWFKKEKFRRFVLERLRYAADRNGCTFDWAVSQIKSLWDGKFKKTKVQMDAMKELNRMLGHVKDMEGRINAREFINAEYVVIQKDNSINLGPQPASLPDASGRGPVEIQVPAMREALGQERLAGLEHGQELRQTQLYGLVPDQPAQAG